MNLFLLSTQFAKSTGLRNSPLHWFLATRLVGKLTSVKRTFKNCVLALPKIVRETKWGIFIEDIPQTTDNGNSSHGFSRPGRLISTKGHIIIYDTLHWKLTFELHEHQQKFVVLLEMNSFITKGEYNIHDLAKLI
jgi:hypothetical protein